MITQNNWLGQTNKIFRFSDNFLQNQMRQAGFCCFCFNFPLSVLLEYNRNKMRMLKAFFILDAVLSLIVKSDCLASFKSNLTYLSNREAALLTFTDAIKLSNK